MTWKTHIKRAVEFAGSQVALAEKSGLSQQAISKMLSEKSWGSGTVSAESAIAIEKATCGAVTRQQLRPDVFGESEPA